MPNRIVITVEECQEDDMFPVEEYFAGYIRLNCGKNICFISTGALNDLSPEQFMDELGKILNDASLISKDLNLEIIVDESVEDIAEETDEGLSDKMYQVYKDFIGKEVV